MDKSELKKVLKELLPKAVDLDEADHRICMGVSYKHCVWEAKSLSGSRKRLLQDRSEEIAFYKIAENGTSFEVWFKPTKASVQKTTRQKLQGD